MSPTIIGDWPEDEPGLGQVYDQRGCCGPMVVGTRTRKLDLRFDVIGERDAGPVGPLWHGLAFGQCMIADAANWRWDLGKVVGFSPGIGQQHYIAFLPFHELPYKLIAFAHFHNNATGTELVDCNAVEINDYESRDFILPVSIAIGPPNPPDRVRIRPLYYNQTSLYGYIGP